MRNLQVLSAGIREVMEDSEMPASFRRGQYFTAVYEISAYMERTEGAPGWMSPFMKIAAFAASYRMAWFVVG